MIFDFMSCTTESTAVRITWVSKVFCPTAILLKISINDKKNAVIKEYLYADLRSNC